MDQSAHANTPQHLSRYLVQGFLGSGGMGEVFRVWDPMAQRAVALKLVRGDLSDRFQTLCFEREVRTLRALQHEHVVRFHDLGLLGERPYYTMEVVDGLSWRQLLERPAPKRDEIRWTLQLFCQLLEVVDRLHQERILHRDLKPDNIMILPSTGAADKTRSRPSLDTLVENPTAQLKLMDFGLVLGFEERCEEETSEPGTPLYMAPERHRPGIGADPRSDLYSLGVLLYQTLTRTAPFKSIGDAVSGRKTPRRPERVHPEISAQLSEIIMRQLEATPHRRSSSTAQLRCEILDCVDEPAVRATRIHVPVFTGRSKEIGTIDTLARNVAGSELPGGQSLLIEGSSDSGKSWLLNRSTLKTRLVLDHRMNYLQGRYDKDGSLHQGIRSILVERLLHLSSKYDTMVLRQLLGPWGKTLFDALAIDAKDLNEQLESAVSDGDPPPESESPALREQQVAECAARILTADTKSRPLAIILENVQRADELDLTILGRLTLRLSHHRILLILTCTSRSGKAPDALERWLEKLRGATEGKSSLQTTHLKGLSDSEVESMIFSMLESTGTPTPPLVSRIVTESRGNPGTVARTLRAHWSRGRVILKDELWDVVETEDDSDSDLSVTDEEHAHAFINSLEKQAQDLLLAASVVGEEFDQELIAEMLRDEKHDSGQSVGETIQKLVDVGMLDAEADVYRFNSNTLRNYCIGQLSTNRRQNYHARVAKVLLETRNESASEVLPRVAHHLEKAGDRERSEEYGLRCAREFAQRGALRRSLESYHRILERSVTQTPRAILLREVGEIHGRLGDFDTALRHLDEAAESLDDGPELLRILQESGRLHQRRGDLEPAESLFERCRKLSKTDERCATWTPEILYCLGCVQFDRNAWNQAIEFCRESLEGFRSQGDVRGMAKTSLVFGLSEMRLGQTDAAMEHIQEAVQSAEHGGITDVLSAALNNLANCHRDRGDSAAATECLKRSLEIRRNVGDRQGLAVCLNNLSRVFFYAGDLRNALDTSREAHDLFRELGDKKGIFVSATNVGGSLLCRGEVQEGRRVLGDNLSRAINLENWRGALDTLQSLALLEESAGQTGNAAKHFEEGRRLLPRISDSNQRAMFLAVYAVHCLSIGKRELATDAIRDCHETRSEIDGTEAHGWVRLAESEVLYQDGEFESARKIAEKALKTFQSSGSRWAAALANRQLACVYREMGPDWVDRTERHFQLASEDLEAMGARLELGLTLLEEAQLWSQLEEIEEALYCLDESARLFRECGASERAKEAKRQIETLDS